MVTSCTMRILRKVPGETMNVRGCTTGEMWIDLLGLTNPTRRLGAGRVHIVSNTLGVTEASVIPSVWAGFNTYTGLVMDSQPQ